MTACDFRRPIRRVSTVVIGGGHCGLAVSHCLAEQGIDHVVLERGEVANAWRRERWDSLRLLTPNWQTRLPGYRYQGADPDGFMAMDQVVRFIHGYARFSGAPVKTHTAVTAVTADGAGYRVATDCGDWWCHTVVMATGAFNLPRVPAMAGALPLGIRSVTPHEYRNPAQLPEGGVLVVGASATGLQIADELCRAGRKVTLAAGEHVRMPRRYRGRDIQYWLQETGLLDDSYRQQEDLQRARRLPSPQLVGSPEKASLDLNAVQRRGVQVVGRLQGISDGVAYCSGGLANVARLADLKQQRLLQAIDEWIECRGMAAAIGTPESPEPTRIDPRAPLSLDLGRTGVATVIWATGYRPDYSWLRLPVLDHRGRLRHDGGVVAAPGVYAMGLPFMRRRKSSFIVGAEDDAREITAYLHAHLQANCHSRWVSVA